MRMRRRAMWVVLAVALVFTAPASPSLASHEIETSGSNVRLVRRSALVGVT